jgi:putative lipoprotein
MTSGSGGPPTVPTPPSAVLYPGVDVPSAAPKVGGTVGYRERETLPAKSVVKVTLYDATRPEAPLTLSEVEIVTRGEQAPIPFELPYRPEEIDPRNIYAVRAEIQVDGRLAWVTDQVFGVLTRGRGREVQVVVVPTAR